MRRTTDPSRSTKRKSGDVVSIHSIHIATGHGEAVSCARDKVGKHRTETRVIKGGAASHKTLIPEVMDFFFILF